MNEQGSTTQWGAAQMFDATAPGGRWVWCQLGEHYVAGPLEDATRGIIFTSMRTGCRPCLTAWCA